MTTFLSVKVDGLGDYNCPIIIDRDDLALDFVPAVMISLTISDKINGAAPMFVARSEIRFGSEYSSLLTTTRHRLLTF